MSEEKFPVEANVDVIKGITVYKTSKWWSAVILGNVNGHNQVILYLWFKEEGTDYWVKKNKFAIHNSKDGETISNTIQSFMIGAGI